MTPLVLAGCLGFLGYSVSTALFVLALRNLGTARTGAYFSTAPFLGAIVTVIFLHEPLTAQVIAAGVLMAIGVWLHLTEVHEHEHEHAPLEHAHSHVHDEHHKHAHASGDPLGEPQYIRIATCACFASMRMFLTCITRIGIEVDFSPASGSAHVRAAGGRGREGRRQGLWRALRSRCGSCIEADRL